MLLPAKFPPREPVAKHQREGDVPDIKWREDKDRSTRRAAVNRQRFPRYSKRYGGDNRLQKEKSPAVRTVESPQSRGHPDKISRRDRDQRLSNEHGQCALPGECCSSVYLRQALLPFQQDNALVEKAKS